MGHTKRFQRRDGFLKGRDNFTSPQSLSRILIHLVFMHKRSKTLPDARIADRWPADASPHRTLLSWPKTRNLRPPAFCIFHFSLSISLFHLLQTPLERPFSGNSDLPPPSPFEIPVRSASDRVQGWPWHNHLAHSVFYFL